MRHHRHLRLAVCLALATACSPDPTGRVRLDLGALHRHALEARLTLSSVTVTASAAHLKAPITAAVDVALGTFELELPAGPKVRFEVVANHQPEGDELPAYWGERTIDLVAGATVELVIPVVPAGSLRSGVETSDGTPLPAELTVTFTTPQPPPELPAAHGAPVVDGVVRAVLPVGFYMVSASFTRDQVVYATPPEVIADIVHGELFAPPEPLLLFPGGGDLCPGDADRDGDTRCDSFDRCPDSFVDDGDLDGVCDDVDTCLGTPNPNQFSICGGDWDGDGEPNETDNCPWILNPMQPDNDQDGFGTPCDCDDNASSCTDDCSDRDGDSTPDCKDPCLDTGVEEEGWLIGSLVIGHTGGVSVGECTIDGLLECDSMQMCNTPSTPPDFDSDGLFDEFEDDCLDADGDGAGIELSFATTGQIITPGNAGANPTTGAALAGADDLLFAAWVHDIGNGQAVWAATSTDGIGFNDLAVPPGTLAPPMTQQSSPAVAIDAAMGLHVAWQVMDGSDFEIYWAKTDDLGETWTPLNLSDAPVSAQKSPALLIGAGGEILVAWEDTRAGQANIYVTRSIDGGVSFSTPSPVRADTAVEQLNPALALHPDGRVFLAWADAMSGNFDIVVAASSDGGATFGPAFRFDDDPGSASAYVPAIAFDAQGRMHLAWEDYRHGTGRVYYRVSEGFHLRQRPARMLYDAEQDQRTPQIVTAALDQHESVVFVAWEQNVSAAFPRVYLARGLASSDDWAPPSPAGMSMYEEKGPALARFSVAGRPLIATGWAESMSSMDYGMQGNLRGLGCARGPDCNDASPWCNATCLDLDDDTVCAEHDCNDLDAAVSPLASEVCDLTDNDCDKLVDEGVGTTVALWDMEGGAPGWTHQAYGSAGGEDDWALVTRAIPGLFGTYDFGTPENHVYGTNGNNGGANETEDSALLSPSFALPTAERIGLTFASYTYNGEGCPTGGGEDGEELELGIGERLHRWSDCGDPRINSPYVGELIHPWYDLSLLRGRADLQLRFHFNTMGSTGNGRDDGWYVDDVRLYTCP